MQTQHLVSALRVARFAPRCVWLADAMTRLWIRLWSEALLRRVQDLKENCFIE